MDDEIATRSVETVTIELTREQAGELLWVLDAGLWLYDTSEADKYDRALAINEVVEKQLTEKLVR